MNNKIWFSAKSILIKNEPFKILDLFFKNNPIFIQKRENRS
jgi:hypothetical protein